MLTTSTDSQQLVIRDKEINQIVTAAYIDNKATRAIIAKCDIEKAISNFLPFNGTLINLICIKM